MPCTNRWNKRNVIWRPLWDSWRRLAATCITSKLCAFTTAIFLQNNKEMVDYLICISNPQAEQSYSDISNRDGRQAKSWAHECQSLADLCMRDWISCTHSGNECNPLPTGQWSNPGSSSPTTSPTGYLQTSHHNFVGSHLACSHS